MWGRILYGIQLKLKWASQCNRNQSAKFEEYMFLHTYMYLCVDVCMYIYIFKTTQRKNKKNQELPNDLNY